jgi:hypothetical protein
LQRSLLKADVSEPNYPSGDGWAVRDDYGLSFVWRKVRLPILCGTRRLMVEQLRDLAQPFTDFVYQPLDGRVFVALVCIE